MKLSKIFKPALGLVALTGALVFGPVGYVKYQDAINKDEIERKISDLEQSLSKKYEMDINLWVPSKEGDRPQHPIKTSLRSHSPYMSLKSLKGLERAMQLYPKELLKNSVLKIEIVRSYKESTEEIVNQNAIPVAYMSFWGGMSISSGRDELLRYHRAVFGTIFENESFHHEIAHQITKFVPEKDWKALHPDAKYNSSSWKSLPNSIPGFYNRYCTHSVDEDIAGTVELLYDKNYSKFVGHDPILRKKAEYLKGWYLKKSKGIINESYWRSVQSGKIPKMRNNGEVNNTDSEF